MWPRRNIRAAQALGTLAVLFLSCLTLLVRSGNQHDHLAIGTNRPTPTPIRSFTPVKTASPNPCPSTYNAPDPYRPTMSLTMTVSDDFSTVTGHEQLTFVPDKPINEIYLRLWPNGPLSASKGARMTVTSASVQGEGVTPTLSESNTLLRLPLKDPVTSPRAIAITTDFTLKLPPAGNDRWGYQQGLAWFGTGFPMLAYEPGYGWATEAPTSAFAETATSQDMSVELSVTAPVGSYSVIANGQQTTHSGQTWTFKADAIRDVAVAVGGFKGALGFAATGVPIQAYVANGVNDSEIQYVNDQTAAINDHVHRLGPFPYPKLYSVTVPGIRGGIEYPGLIFYGPDQHNATPSHEVAHQWFYGLVGNDQARDPWLDESLATFIEALHRSTDYSTVTIPTDGLDKVGEPMSYWEPRTADYFNSVYIQGANALIKARNLVGPAKFDATLRCYINSHAHSIARPADFAGVFRSLPPVIQTLRDVGALR